MFNSTNISSPTALVAQKRWKPEQFYQPEL